MGTYDEYVLNIRKNKQTSIKKIVNEMNGQWLNDTVNVSSHYFCELTCSNNHKFSLYNATLLRGLTWCPTCKISHKNTGEELCRMIISNLLGEYFPKTRNIKGLVSKKGVALEIDGFSDQLKIGFEYQGQQHYEFSKFFHQKRKDFDKTQQRDEFKNTFFRNKGWRLLQIKYFNNFNLKKCIRVVQDELNRQEIKYSELDIQKLQLEYKLIIEKNSLNNIVTEARKCKNATEFKLFYRKLYTIAKDQGMISTLFPKKSYTFKRNKTWTIEELTVLAKKYKKRCVLFTYDLSAYKYANKNDLLNLIFKDLEE